MYYNLLHYLVFDGTSYFVTDEQEAKEMEKEGEGEIIEISYDLDYLSELGENYNNN